MIPTGFKKNDSKYKNIIKSMNDIDDRVFNFPILGIHKNYFFSSQIFFIFLLPTNNLTIQTFIENTSLFDRLPVETPKDYVFTSKYDFINDGLHGSPAGRAQLWASSQ